MEEERKTAGPQAPTGRPRPRGVVYVKPELYSDPERKVMAARLALALGLDQEGAERLLMQIGRPPRTPPWTSPTPPAPPASPRAA